jgi:hypothetical protein
MKSFGRIGYGAALGLVSLACSGSTLGSAGTAGAGGVVLTGQGGATGGQDGGAVTTVLALPSCLRDLLAPCATQGACTATTAPAGWGDFCFDSGVRASASTVTNAGLCGGTKSVMKVNKPDGTLCYTFESFREETCQFWWGSWKDAAGNPVAQTVWGADPNWAVDILCNETRETVGCDGPPPIAYPPPGCCNISQFGDAVCAGGAPMGACANGTCP